METASKRLNVVLKPHRATVFFDFSVFDPFVSNFLLEDDYEVLAGIWIFFLVEIFLPRRGETYLCVSLVRRTRRTHLTTDNRRLR